MAERLTIRLQNRKKCQGEGRDDGKWTRTAREEAVLTEDSYGVYEEQADVKNASEEKHD